MKKHPEKEKPQPAGDGGKGQTESSHADAVTLPRQEFEALSQQLAELESLREKMMRTAADFENAKKRLMRERDDFAAFAQERLIREMLPILDNFERALSHAGEVEDPKAKNVITGVQMVFKQMNEVLKAEGLERLETAGKIFDPHVHEAVAHVEEPGRDHEILAEIQAGYRLKGRFLRAAKVRIRNAPPSGSAKSEESAA